MDEDKKDNGFLSGLVIGGLLGAAVAFFVGKEEGKQLEKIIKKKGKILLDNLGDTVEDGQEKVEEKLKDVSDQVAEAKETVQDKADDLEKSGKTSLRRFFVKAGKKLAK